MMRTRYFHEYKVLHLKWGTQIAGYLVGGNKLIDLLNDFVIISIRCDISIIEIPFFLNELENWSTRPRNTNLTWAHR